MLTFSFTLSAVHHLRIHLHMVLSRCRYRIIKGPGRQCITIRWTSTFESTRCVWRIKTSFYLCDIHLQYYLSFLLPTCNITMLIYNLLFAIMFRFELIIISYIAQLHIFSLDYYKIDLVAIIVCISRRSEFLTSPIRTSSHFATENVTWTLFHLFQNRPRLKHDDHPVKIRRENEMTKSLKERLVLAKQGSHCFFPISTPIPHDSAVWTAWVTKLPSIVRRSNPWQKVNIRKWKEILSKLQAILLDAKVYRTARKWWALSRSMKKFQSPAITINKQQSGGQKTQLRRENGSRVVSLQLSGDALRWQRFTKKSVNKKNFQIVDALQQLTQHQVQDLLDHNT